MEEKNQKLNKDPEDKKKVNSGDGSDLFQRAKSLGVKVLQKKPEGVESDIISLIPRDVALRYGMVAFGKEGNVVKVAMLNPGDIEAQNALRFIAEKENIEIQSYLTDDGVFKEIFGLYEGPGEIVKEAIRSFKEESFSGLEGIISGGGSDQPESSRKKKEEILKEAPVAKLVQVIISHAIEGEASDIHIEPMEDEYRVRFRIDGVLHVSLILPKEIGPVVTSRIKILANLKIDEKRKPQDGRFRLNNNGKDIDFRVSTLPVLNGEKVVMRILDKESGLADLESLGLLGTAMENLKLAIAETYGMILMTGPTGSGKSTTLYAILKILNKEERNIITLEDPVEYNIEGLNQSQVKPEIGYTFASGLRTVLRQDPNVIMVGEIRDSETAELAVHAALTGHLMFSTLHTNTALGAIPRLIDMGIEPFLLSSSIRMVMSQRLARKICDFCREERPLTKGSIEKIKNEIASISDEEIKKYGVDISSGIKVYHGKGCEKCNGTGLKGRVAVYEVIPISDIMKTIITEKDGEENLLVAERNKAGILTMKQDGILKILKGITTVEEIERITEGGITLEEENL